MAAAKPLEISDCYGTHTKSHHIWLRIVNYTVDFMVRFQFIDGGVEISFS
jgi:hypothetical protein